MEKEFLYVEDNVNKAIEKGLNELGLTEEQVKIEVLEGGSNGFLGLFKKQAKVKLVPLVDDVEKYIKKNKEKVKNIETKAKKKVNNFTEKIVEKAVDVVEKNIDSKVITIEKDGQKLEGEEKKEAFDLIKKHIKEDILENNNEIEEVKEEITTKKDKPKREDYIVTNSEKIVAYLENIVRSMGYKDAVVTFEENGNRHFTLNIKTEESTSLIIGKRGVTLNSLQFLVNNYAKKFSSHFFRIIVDCDNYRENRKKTLEELALNLAKKSKKLGKPVDLEPMTSEERKIIHNALSGKKNVETESRGEEPYRYLVIHAK